MKIFENAMLGNLNLKNRMIRSATWENLAEINGSIDEKTYKIYSELAKGGVGAIITGFTSVMSEDFYFGGMMRLSEDFLIPQYKKLTEIVHAENCKIISQLALGVFYKNSVEIAENDLTDADIEKIIEKFISASIRAEKANFDSVQIHAAHFFFLSRFISPACNKNKNRTEILEKILLGIKNSTNLHVTIKINCSDFVDGWRSLEEMEKILRETEIKFLSLSRPLIREPDLPKKFLNNEQKISKCVSCNACYSTPSHRCIFVK